MFQPCTCFIISFLAYQSLHAPPLPRLIKVQDHGTMQKDDVTTQQVAPPNEPGEKEGGGAKQQVKSPAAVSTARKAAYLQMRRMVEEAEA